MKNNNNLTVKQESVLLAEHAVLMNEGFPPEKTKRFWEKVELLSDDSKEHLHKMIEVSKLTKDALIPRMPNR